MATFFMLGSQCDAGVASHCGRVATKSDGSVLACWCPGADCARGEPGSQLGKVEVYEPRDMRGNRNVKWSMDMLKDLAEKTALKIKKSFKNVTRTQLCASNEL